MFCGRFGRHFLCSVVGRYFSNLLQTLRFKGVIFPNKYINKYLSNNDIEKSIISNEDASIWSSAYIKIITTADYFEIEQVKEQLAIILKNSAIVSSYKELGSEDLPEPKSGAIKYLLSAYEYSHTWNSDDPFIISMDYIDGKYHGFYKTLLANNPNK